MFKVVRAEEFVHWFNQQTTKEQAQIRARIVKIRLEGYFGHTRKLTDDIAELKWRNGRRVYFSLKVNEHARFIILLLGGNKNSQKSDIQQASNILRKLSEEE